MRPIIQSRKHIVQIPLSTVLSTAANSENLVHSIEGSHATSIDVSEGATVKAVWVELWLLNSAAALGSFTVIVVKNPGGANSPTTADMAALHDWDNKKNIFYTSQGITPRNTTFPMNVLKQWIKIPKGKQRFGLNDRLTVAIRNNVTDDLNYCGSAIYKEYT